MDYNTVFFSNVIFNICSELGIKNIIFSLDDSITENETMASVYMKGINGQETDKGDKFTINYDPEIIIHSDYFDSFTQDICSCFTKSNESVNELLKTAILENAIIHELRHLYQFMTIELNRDNLDIQTNDEEKTYGFIINHETKIAFENDANNFMLSKIDTTILKDKKLKYYLTNLEYDNVLISINRDMLLHASHNGSDSRPYFTNIEKHTSEVKKWFELLDNHIINNY